MQYGNQRKNDDAPAEDVAGTAAEEVENDALVGCEEINGANVADGVEVLLEEDVAYVLIFFSDGTGDIFSRSIIVFLKVHIAHHCTVNSEEN